MRKTIRLTEADLSRLIRRIIKENPDDVLTCLMTATGMDKTELTNLVPCGQLQQDPTNTTNIQACIAAVIPMVTSILAKEIFKDPFGVPKKILDVTTKCAACAGNVSPVMNENKRRINRR